MEYIDVQWLHEDAGFPVRMISELDDERWETRKLEFYADGRVGMADRSLELLGTRLGLAPSEPFRDQY